MTTEKCIHFWLIVGRLGTCKKCHAEKTFDDGQRVPRAVFKEQQRWLQQEIWAAKQAKG